MIYELTYIMFCVALAWLNYKLIKGGIPIHHFWNALLHLSLWITLYLISNELLLAIIFPFLGRLFFDTSLNVMRDGWRNIGYVPRYPKSIIDKLEKKAFGKNGIAPKITYAIIIVILNMFLCL